MGKEKEKGRRIREQLNEWMNDMFLTVYETTNICQMNGCLSFGKSPITKDAMNIMLW